MRAVLQNPVVFDWRIVVCVAITHLAFFLTSLLSFDLFKPERPLEIAIEVSGDVAVISGAKEASIGRQALSAQEPAQKKTPTALQPTKPVAPTGDVAETVSRASGSGTGVSSAAASTTQTAQATSQAGGMEAAARVRPDVSAKLTKNPKPIYPKKAFEDRQEGVVLLNVEVLETGKTGQVLLAKSSGVSSLDVSALEAVKLWQFTPAKAGGQIVKQWVQVPIKFSLAREGVR